MKKYQFYFLFFYLFKENVKAVILVNSPNYPDILSHVSVRARNWLFEIKIKKIFFFF